ncbi:MAG: radical SAM protein [Candidatus Odinarchaeota archaeon]
MTKLVKVPPRTGQIIYGPIHSRRIGVDIGINLLVQEGKTCNFNCVYCQYGHTDNPVKQSRLVSGWINPPSVYDALETALAKLSTAYYNLDAVTFSGYGEPTLHPKFTNIVKAVKNIKDKYYPAAKLTLITNSSTITDPRIQKTLELFDQILAKLDAATNKAFHAINRPVNKNLDVNTIIDGLTLISGRVKHLIIQTLLFNTTDPEMISNTSDEEIIHLGKSICKIKPKEAQLYTIVRKPALNTVKPAEDYQLKKLKKYIEEVCGGQVPVKIY